MGSLTIPTSQIIVLDRSSADTGRVDDTGRSDLYARERAVRFTPGTVL
eukprot:COSAG04_NODE_18794_length_432_cov_1.087087_1_plen_47_part_10